MQLPYAVSSLLMRRPDSCVGIGLFGLLLAMFGWQEWHSPEPTTRVLIEASEYRQIALALLEGRGFADPFGPTPPVVTPTAWMPPLLPFYLALLYKLLGADTMLAAWAAMLTKFAATSLTVYLLVRMLARTRYHRLRYFPALPFAAAVVLKPHFFDAFFDEWLIHLGLTAVLYAVAAPVYTPRIRRLLLLLALVLPLISPNLALTLVLLMVVQAGWVLWQARRESPLNWQRTWQLPFVRLSVACAALFVSSMGFWTLRNYLALGRVVPIKSNLWYEFYQANVLDDGVVGNDVFLHYHPFIRPEVRARYATLGEMAFLDSCKATSVQYLQRDWDNFLQKVGRRAAFAFVLADGGAGMHAITDERVSAADIACLESARLTIGPNWTCLGWPQQRVKRKIDSLALAKPDLIMADWLGRHHEQLASRHTLVFWLKSTVVTLLPVLVALLGWTLRPLRRSRLFVFTVTAYLVFLMPYVLVSIYQRYLFSALPVQVLLLSFGGVYVLYGLRHGWYQVRERVMTAAR